MAEQKLLAATLIAAGVLLIEQGLRHSITFLAVVGFAAVSVGAAFIPTSNRRNP